MNNSNIKNILPISSKTKTKTKKIKEKSKSINKKLLWDKFQTEIKDTDNKNDSKMECIYRNDEKTGNRENCDICQSSLIITDEGFQVCTNNKCGILYKDSLDHSAEWRFYGADDNQNSDPTRCGMPINPLLKESSYGCRVLCVGKSSHEMRIVRRYTEWQSMPYREKSQYDEFQKISILASQSGIPKLIVDDAILYHKKISEAKTFRGLNRDGIIAASIYVASRINNYPRTPKEIATIFHLDNTSATKGCKNAISIINELENTKVNSEKTNLCQTTPSSFIERYCSKLNMNYKLTKLCTFIALHIQKANIIPENTPHSIAAGIIYFISQTCHINLTKKEISNVSEISEVTINKCYKKLEKIKDKLIPKSILNEYNN